MMALSPVLYVGYISATARFGSLGAVVFEGDPPGFSERLEAYRELVVECARLAKAGGSGRSVESAIEKASKELPRLESTRFGATSEQDVRAPIVIAQQRAFEALDQKLRQLRDAGKMADAVKLAAEGFAVADILRLSDSGSLTRSTGFQSSLVSSIKQCLPRVSSDELEKLANELIVYESKRPPVAPVLRNEMNLLIVESTFWNDEDPRNEALRLAMDAMKASLAGESIVRFVKQASALEAGRVRDDVWQTLVSWQLAMKSEDQSQRLIRSLIVEVRSRQLALRGEPFDSQTLLRLPKEVFSQTIQKRVPKLVVEKWRAYLEFGKPSDEIVAAR